MLTSNDIEDVVQEMNSLSIHNKFQINAWRIFFEREDMKSVVIQQRFLRALGDCLYLKRIDNDLYTYLNEQLNNISGRLKEYGLDYAGSEEMAALDYAKSKVKAAKQYEKANDKSYVKVVGIILAVVSICFPVFSRYMIALDNQNREQERKAFQEQYMEHEAEIMEQHQETIQDMLQENSEFSEGVKQQMKVMLEEGEITQEQYDSLMQQFGFDETEAEEETP